jgi:nucleoside-diphosphate-sugar epimerase
MATAFVTGATGLLGCHLIEKLLARGDSVRVLVRPASNNSILDKFPLEKFVGELDDPEVLEYGVNGADVVYHCAARPPLDGTRNDFLQDNVQGTENLLRACVDSGIKRFVFISTIDVYGYFHHDGATESTPLRADGLYSESKIEAENLVFKYSEKEKLPYTIFRPCLLYGYYDRNMFPAVLKHISQKRVPLVDGGKRLANLVYAGDVADAMIRASESAVSVAQIYNITDGVRRTARDIIMHFGNAIGIRPNIVNAPYLIAFPLSLLVRKVAQFFKLRIPNQFRREGIKAMGHNRHFDISKIKRDLRFNPTTNPEEGLGASADWHRANSFNSIIQNSKKDRID